MLFGPRKHGGRALPVRERRFGLMRDFSIILFDGFETLDAMGPAEIVGVMKETYRLRFFSRNGGIVTSDQGARVDTLPFSDIQPGGVILIPGGAGTRVLIRDAGYIAAIRELSEASAYTLTVCTGSPVLAMTGLLDGLAATSNKQLFSWAQSVNTSVRWLPSARWVADGKFYTSSGVTAGMDMTLGFVRDTVSYAAARAVAEGIEYLWNEDKDADPFAKS